MITITYKCCNLIGLENSATKMKTLYNELVTQVNQQQQFKRAGSTQANATISNVYQIHKQQ